MAEFHNQKINTIIIASFLLVTVTSGIIFLLITNAQKPISVAGERFSDDFLTVEGSDEWRENEGGWVEGPIDNKTGIIVLHPLSTKETKYIERTVNLLPGKNYAIQVVAANIAGKAEFAISGGCDDSLIVISAKSESNEKREEFVLKPEDGWIILSMDMSEFAGQRITIKIEGKAGGPCGMWNGEWSAIDKVEIINY